MRPRRECAQFLASRTVVNSVGTSRTRIAVHSEDRVRRGPKQVKRVLPRDQNTLPGLHSDPGSDGPLHVNKRHERRPGLMDIPGAHPNDNQLVSTWVERGEPRAEAVERDRARHADADAAGRAAASRHPPRDEVLLRGELHEPLAVAPPEVVRVAVDCGRHVPAAVDDFCAPPRGTHELAVARSPNDAPRHRAFVVVVVVAPGAAPGHAQRCAQSDENANVHVVPGHGDGGSYLLAATNDPVAAKGLTQRAITQPAYKEDPTFSLEINFRLLQILFNKRMATKRHLAIGTISVTAAVSVPLKTFRCTVCSHRLRDPVTFPCFHSMCLACAQKRISDYPALPLGCPVCSTKFGSASPTVNVNLAAVIDGEDLLQQHLARGSHGTSEPSICGLCKKRPAQYQCETCGMLCAKHLKKLHAMQVFESHEAVELQIDSEEPAMMVSPKSCEICNCEKRNLFCKQCNEVICAKCDIIGAHRQHDCIDLYETRKFFVSQLSANEVYLSNRKAELMAFKSQLETLNRDIETEQRNQCHAVKERIHELRKLLKDKENELCSFIEMKQYSKHSDLMRQLHVIEDQLSVINCGVSCIEISNQIVGEEDPFGFVSFRVPSIHAAASISQFPSTKTLPLVASAPLEESQLDCNDLTSAIKALKLLPSVDAKQSKIVRLDAGPVFRYEEPVLFATIQACDKNGKPSKITSSIICSCVGPGPATIEMQPIPEKEKRGQLTVTMSPTGIGEHTVTVQVNDKHIVGSPLVVEVIDPKIAFPGSKILTTLFLNCKLHHIILGAEQDMGHRMTHTAWRLLWRGSEHGFGASKFHKLCNKIAPTVSIIRTASKYVCGGYTPLKFSNSGEHKGGCGGRNFLFSLVRAGVPSPPTILRCKEHTTCIFCSAESGPVFGQGLHVCDNSDTQALSFSDLATPPSWAGAPPPQFLVGSRGPGWLVEEIEVWTPN
ncbi:hypothetical protein Pelo_9372 [Pelomyxa schiedti]|nr:hypothetical protein Pelo_9372 [Pelomyxa schiedti]